MITFLKQRNIRLIVLRTPVPLRFYKLLPEEDKFNQQLQALLTKHNVEYHDFSLVDNDEKYFFNSDHLNQAGVLNFYDKHLKQVLTQTPQAVTN
jgi:outer membrane receptor for ferrienterochelin and colicin